MAAPMSENVMSSFRTEFLKTDKNKTDFNSLLEISEDNKLFAIQKKGPLQEIISHVHSCLNTSKHRVEGLIFLDQLLGQCVTEVFRENAVTWIRFILQCLKSHDSADVKKVGVYVGSKILPLTVNFKALSQDLFSLLPQLLTVALSADSEWLPEAFQLINVCIQSYPGPCGTFKGKIEAKLLGLLLEQDVPPPAITTYVLLEGCGGGGPKGVKHTEAWSNKCQQILSTLNKVLGLLYEGLNVIDSDTKSNIQCLPMKELPESPVDRFNLLVNYYTTYSHCLQELLSQPFPAPVKVPVEDILQIIYNTLSVNSKALHKRPSTERLILSGHVSTIHREAISSLQVLFSRCKTLLLPYAKSILSLLVQELVWSRVAVTYGQNGAFNLLRETVYETLSLWLQTTQSFTETTSEIEWLVQEILHDTRPHTDIMKVESSKGKHSHGLEPPPTKKKKKGGYSELSHGISSQRKIDLTANSELCVQALEALYCFISSIGCQLKQNIVQEIQEFIVSVGLTFRAKGNYGIPYTCDRCRHRLLMVMQAFNLMPHPTAASILQYSLSIFRSTVQDSSSLVSSFSIESLNICEPLIHARAPCFIKPKIVEKEIISDVPQDKEQDKKVSSETSNVTDHNRKKSLFETNISTSGKSDKGLLKPGKLFGGNQSNMVSKNNSFKSAELSNNALDENQVSQNKGSLASFLVSHKMSGNTKQSKNTEQPGCSKDILTKQSKNTEQPGCSKDIQVSDEEESTSTKQETPIENTVEINKDIVDIETKDSENDSCMVQNSEIVSPQEMDTDTVHNESEDSSMQNEDQEDLDDILSTFVDTDKD